MADVTTLDRAIDFFRQFGLFKIILPFLLVFTIVFAILEKSKILGEEKVGSDMVPKRNLNSIVAFVVGLLVVAAVNVVGVINSALPKVTLLIIVGISFLMLAGTFLKGGDLFDEDKGIPKKARYALMLVSFISVVLIFLNELGWLDKLWDYIVLNWTGPVVGAFVILIVILAVMWLVVGGKPKEGAPSGDT